MSTATFNWDNQSFTASEQGFRWQAADGKVHEGPWDRIESVMAMAVTAKVNGIDVGTWQHFGVALEGGGSFRVQTRDKAARAVAELTIAYAAPRITARVLERLEAGATVQFGPVSVSKNHFGVRGKLWPLSELAGHRTAHGYWMVDVGPGQKPHLAAQVMLKDLPSHFALRAALARLVPDHEYPEKGPDRGTLMRPSASSHDPRYLSGRARVLLMGGAIAAAALVGLGVWGGFEISRRAEQRRVENARAQTAAKVGALTVAGRAAAIPDAPIACAELSKIADGVLFLVEVPAGVEHPYRGAPYVLSSSGLHELYPFDQSQLAVVARVQSFAKGQGQHELMASAAVLDAATGRVECSGRISVGVSGAVDPPMLLAKGLAAAICSPTSAAPTCKRVMGEVRPLIPALASAPKIEPVAAPAPKYAKGQHVEVQRKGKWTRAVITAKAKTGWRIHYEGTNAGRDEVVPETRMRPR